MKQKTIGRPFSLSGIGLHSGKGTSLTCQPAEAGAGIVFIVAGKKIPALVINVTGTTRGTTLGGLATTEHLLAAVYALGIDNLEIIVAGEELPSLDGSAAPFVAACRAAGLTQQDQPKKTYVLESPISVGQEGASLKALPYNGFKVDFMVDFPGIGQQQLCFDLQKDSFERELAPARTFGYLKEHAQLKKHGLALGASLDNALVFDEGHYLNAPRFPDELVRHKILDLIGDLALLGCPLKARLIAVKSSHCLNVELVRRILAHG